MATFNVVSSRVQKMSYSGTKEDKVTCNYTKVFDVEVTDTDGVTPLSDAALREVDVVDVLNASGIPKCNRSMYTVGQFVVPYIICRSVSAEQHPDRLSRWKVTSTWNGEYEGAHPSPVAKSASVDYAPKATMTLGEMERVLYADFSDQKGPPSVKKPILSPSKSWYDEPAVERIATFERKVQQYETSVTYEQARDRRFKVNSGTYTFNNVTYPRYTWLIENVEWTLVTVELSGGGTTSAALMTYTLLYNPMKDNDGNQIGWKDDRILIDTHYLKFQPPLVDPVRTEFKDSALGLQNVGYIDAEGLKRVSQTGFPDSIQFETYETINFGSFLQL